MSSRASWIGPLLALWVLALPGCNEGEEAEPVITPVGLAAQQCAQLVQCSCGIFTNENIQACTDQLTVNLDSVTSAAEAAGLEYDAECAARQSNWVDELGCAIQNDELLAESTCALNCPGAGAPPLFVGTGSVPT